MNNIDFKKTNKQKNKKTKKLKNFSIIKLKSQHDKAKICSFNYYVATFGHLHNYMHENLLTISQF